MAEQCFKKMVTNPPVCGVHNVPLKQSQISIDGNAPGLGQINCLKCPVSQVVALDARRFQALNSAHPLQGLGRDRRGARRSVAEPLRRVLL
jgi:hypothetical protein